MDFQSFSLDSFASVRYRHEWAAMLGC